MLRSRYLYGVIIAIFFESDLYCEKTCYLLRALYWERNLSSIIVRWLLRFCEIKVGIYKQAANAQQLSLSLVYKNEKEKFFLLCYRQKTKMKDEDEISRLRDEGL
jgi:hypothetical protein